MIEGDSFFCSEHEGHRSLGRDLTYSSRAAGSGEIKCTIPGNLVSPSACPLCLYHVGVERYIGILLIRPTSDGEECCHFAW